MDKTDPLDALLRDTHELEAFLHPFLEQLPQQQLKLGEDVTRYAEQFGLELPATLKGAAITWAGQGEGAEHGEAAREQTLVLAQPGHADAIGLTIKCVTIKGVKFCLECGWIYCRIVVKKRF
jgi:hypothetical protein